MESTKKELEDAMLFGQTLIGLEKVLWQGVMIFKSKRWPDEIKRKSADLLGKYRAFTMDLVQVVDEKHAGIEMAEQAKRSALKYLAEFERAAQPYLK